MIFHQIIDDISSLIHAVVPRIPLVCAPCPHIHFVVVLCIYVSIMSIFNLLQFCSTELSSVSLLLLFSIDACTLFFDFFLTQSFL